MTSKPGDDHLPRDEPGGNLSTAQAVSGMETARAWFRLWHGTWEPVALIPSIVHWAGWPPDRPEGGPQAAGTVRGRVPTRGTGTDRPVVAVRPGNAGGAKGTGHRGSVSGQP